MCEGKENGSSKVKQQQHREGEEEETLLFSETRTLGHFSLHIKIIGDRPRSGTANKDEEKEQALAGR